jgi:nickel-dependent lactate racemase
MEIAIEFGLEHLSLDVDATRFLKLRRKAPSPVLRDPAEAMRVALESPRGFPALRKALTPDDRVVLVLDEQLPHLNEIVPPVLEHMGEAHVCPEAITVLSDHSGPHRWFDELPEPLQKISIETHEPANRRRLSYLATTRQGRRIYLNRTLVDADEIVVLSGRGYDPLLGYSGAQGCLYPALADDRTFKDLFPNLSVAPAGSCGPVRYEADEVTWLLGAPFFIQVIEGSGDDLVHILAGLAETASEGEQMLNAEWRVEFDQPADTVVATISGSAFRHSFASLASALACAGRIVKPEGRIILLTDANPDLGRGAELVMQADEPGRALALVGEERPRDMAAAFQWARAVQSANVYLLSGLPIQIAEDLFTTPLDHADQVHRLIRGSGSCALLPDAHKMQAVIRR